jgi:hypothetical protein
MTRRVWVLPSSVPPDPSDGGKTSGDPAVAVTEGSQRRRLGRLRTKGKKPDSPKISPNSDAAPPP